MSRSLRHFANLSLIIGPVEFSHLSELMVFHWSLRDQQVSRTLLSILADFNNAVAGMVSAHSPISNSSSPLTKPLWMILSAPLTIGISIIIVYSLEFFTSATSDGLSLEIEWQQVSRTLLSILTVFNNAVVWMVSTRPPTSKSSRLFNNSLITVPNYYYHYYYYYYYLRLFMPVLTGHFFYWSMIDRKFH